MPEIHPVAAVALAHDVGLEAARDVVSSHPDLVVAVGQVGRVHELQLVGQVLRDGQPGARVRFVRDQIRLQPHLAQARCLLETSTQPRAYPSGDVREHLLLGDVAFLAAHFVQRPPGHQQRHDVGLGQRGVGGQRRFSVARLAVHGQDDVVVARCRVQPQIEGRDDAAFFQKGDGAALHLVAVFVERDLAALEHGERAGEPRFVWRAQHTQVRAHLGARQVVVHQNRSGGLHLHVEPHAIEQRVALFGEVQRSRCGERRQQTRVEVDVASQARFPDQHFAADQQVAVPFGQSNGGVRQAAQIEWRVKRHVGRVQLEAHVAKGALAYCQAARTREGSPVEPRRQARERDPLPGQLDAGVQTFGDNLGLVHRDHHVRQRDVPAEVGCVHRAGGRDVQLWPALPCAPRRSG